MSDQLTTLKRQLMSEIRYWIKQSGLKQQEVADILCISRSRVSELVNLKLNKFSVDALVNMVAHLDGQVKCQVSIL